jgi:hypothetical protein
MAKSWAEKLTGAKPAHVSAMTSAMWGLKKGDKIFIATPVMVRDYMKKIRKGSARTIEQMRAEFATAHKADATCPMTASIFARIAAEAALEEMEDGRPADKITPFWRLIDAKSPIAKKLSCGTAFVAKMRAKEGIA